MIENYGYQLTILFQFYLFTHNYLIEHTRIHHGLHL